MRAAIYTRVSTDEQARHGVSLDAQADACRAYCKLKQLGVVAVLSDEGVSSGVPLQDRPAGQPELSTTETRQANSATASGSLAMVVAYGNKLS